ncbi:MAG: hypothetical protein D6780_05970, partial [Candidatus Dadabacteria bacterium]
MKKSSQKGLALLSVLFFLAAIVLIMMTYTLISRYEALNLKSSKHSLSGFNAAEAGLNLRAQLIKDQFVNYNRPTGTSPSSPDDCSNPDTQGSGDFACQTYQFEGGQKAITYVVEDESNPTQIVIPTGEAYAGLLASEYRFTVTSVGKNKKDETEAYLELIFKTRLIPLFQFLLFFDGDLELVEGGNIVLGGPIHSNKDIYYAQQAAWWIPDPYSYFGGPVTAAGTMYRGPKFQTSCFGGSGGWSGGWYYDIFISNLANYVALPPCDGNRYEIEDDDLTPFNGNVLKGVPALTVPDVNTFKAFAVPDPAYPNTFTYWDRADVRFVLRLTDEGIPDTTNAATGIEVVNVDGSVMSDATAKLNDANFCPGNHVTSGGAGRAVGAKGDWASYPQYSGDTRLRLFRDYQHYPEVDNYETVLDVDIRNLLNCMHNYASDFFGSGDIDDSSDNGLVLFFAIDGPLADADQNNYAVRFSNASELQATVGGAPAVKGLTLVTDQKAVLWGDFNAVNWIPAAVISDSQYILSNNWTDALSETSQSWTNRFTNVTTLTVQAAFLTGAMPSCGGDGVTCEGSLNDFGGGYTGMFRFNETFYDGSGVGSTTWTQQPMVWKGSLVSLGAPKHNQTLLGPFNYFSSPSYDYAYDTRFNNPANLPPLTPQAVYNKQELFE